MDASLSLLSVRPHNDRKCIVVVALIRFYLIISSFLRYLFVAVVFEYFLLRWLISYPFLSAHPANPIAVIFCQCDSLCEKV